jgi:hypothetical protein
LKSTRPEPAIDPNKIAGAMEELLTNSRAISQILTRPDRLLPEDYLEHVLRRSERFSSRITNPRRIELLIARCMEELDQTRAAADEPIREIIDKAIRTLDEAKNYLRRERVTRPTRASDFERISPDVAQRIREYLTANPGASQQETSQALNVSVGRVSEVTRDTE